MKKSFFYKGKLVRTSQNHTYNYAVACVDESGIILSISGCRRDLASAQSLLNEKQKYFGGKKLFQIIELSETK